MLHSEISELEVVKEQREEAIEIAKANCIKLKNFIKYGIPSFMERMPGYTTSILSQTDSYMNKHDIKCDILTDELEDNCFVVRMKSFINSLPETYRSIFVSVYINGKSIRSFHRSDIYTILKRGYLKLAIFDSTIDYTAEQEMKYQNLKVSHNAKKTVIIKRMKAKLTVLQSLYLSKAVLIKTNEYNYYSLINVSARQNQFNYYVEMIRWINELHTLKANTGLCPKDALMKFITDVDWKYLDTSDRRNLNKGILALAYLDPDIHYTYEELKYDSSEYVLGTAFLNAIKNFQFSLPI